MPTRFFYALVAFVLCACAPQKFVYQGEYVQIRVNQAPIDEFKVDDLVVVAFEYKEQAPYYDIYQFVVIKDNIPIRNIYLNWLDYEEEGYGEYALVEYIKVMDRLLLYGTYDKKPDYETVKRRIPAIAKGQVMPLLDTDKIPLDLMGRIHH